MKKAFLMTAFVALTLSSQAFAVDMNYNSDTTIGSDNMSVRSDTSGTTTKHVKKHHHRKKTSGTYKGHPTNAGSVPARSKYMDDSLTSRQGMPSGETHGPVSGQTDDQNYGQPMNH